MRRYHKTLFEKIAWLDNNRKMYWLIYLNLIRPFEVCKNKSISFQSRTDEPGTVSQLISTVSCKRYIYIAFAIEFEKENSCP